MYSTEDLQLRKAWIAEIISSKTFELLEQIKLGNLEFCKCLQTKIKLSLAYLEILDMYDPEEDFNYITDKQIDNIMSHFEKFFEVCFYPKSLA